MTRTFFTKGMEIVQCDLQQILLRGKGDGSFADTINKEVSLLPPTDNLRMVNNDEFLFAKQSFDQWSLVCLKPKPEKEMSRLIAAFSNALICTKTSLSPSSGSMKPYPFFALNHLIFPLAIFISSINLS